MESNLRRSYNVLRQMAALLLVTSVVKVAYADQEMALLNVTRTLAGDIFTLSGSNCGPTRCMEVSHGTALSVMDSKTGCSCQCSQDTPAFRDDQMICVNQIEEYLMASFGGAKRPMIPYVFLPLKGQIIYPSKEIIFTDVEEATCAVTSAQYLSPSGWVTLRDVTDNDVPFSVYRDEGSTFLQWRGSAGLHTRLEGRLVAVHVLCSSSPRVASSCAAFRIAGNASPTPLYDVRSIPFHAGEVIPSEPSRPTSGLTILESVAIGVCVLMLIFVYAAGITFYIHYKKRQKIKNKDPESRTVITDNTSDINSRIDMDSLRLKQNPLLNIENMGYNSKGYSNDSGLSDASEPSDNSYSQNSQKKVSALIHSRRKKQSRSTGSRSPSTPERVLEMSQRRSVSPDGLEVAPHSDLSIVDCSVENNSGNRMSAIPTGEPVIRRKLYFNPDFFETEHLKNPPPAAIDFLIKIREVMDIAKEKMTSKRFYPILSDIPEEESYHTIDLGWDIPCARQGRRFSAISLKRENSRKAIHCGGCPGCDNNIHILKSSALSRSNSCKECFSEDYKQNIVKKWLDEVPSPPPQLIVRPIKSIAKVSGTPRVIEPKAKEETIPNVIENTGEIVTHLLPPVQATKIVHYDKEQDVKIESEEKPIIIENNEIPSYLLENEIPKKTGTRRVRRKLPPPPAPPVAEIEPVYPEVKKKMEAVIQELNKCRRQDMPQDQKEVPKLIIPITALDTQFINEKHIVPKRRGSEIALQDQSMYFDSLERDIARKRRLSIESSSTISSRRPSIPNSITLNSVNRVAQSWLDTKEAGDGCPTEYFESHYGQRVVPINEVFVNQDTQFYNNTPKMGALTIEVRGSPVEEQRSVSEEFDPDTLDRNSRKNSLCTTVIEPTIRVEKILLKSGGSFKFNSFSNADPVYQNSKRDNANATPEDTFSRKIGSLRQIFEARNSFKQEERNKPYYERRGSLPYGTSDLTSVRRHSKTPDLIRQIDIGENPAPVPFKLRRGSDASVKSRKSLLSDNRLSEERDKFALKDDMPRRSGRRSTKTRSKRTDLKKLTKKIEDSGYLSTDSNESKRRARYFMQLRPKNVLPDNMPVPVEIKPNNTPTLPVESDTDDFESLCDGHSESGAESIETDSVFFGNIDDPNHMFSELGRASEFHSQIDSGFVGETVIVSGDSDSEHKSVISIIAGRDGRGSAASVLCDDEEQCGTLVD